MSCCSSFCTPSSSLHCVAARARSLTHRRVTQRGPCTRSPHGPLALCALSCGPALTNSSKVQGEGVPSTHCSRVRVLARSSSSGNGAGTAGGQGLGVVIVDHGSKKQASNEMLVEFVQLYKQTTGAQIVEPAHMEIAEPSIEQAIGACVKAGAQKIVVAPYFLSRGRHIQEDIPAMVSEAQQKYPETPCVMAEPIGIDPLMAQLIHNRVAKAVEEPQTVSSAAS